AFPQDDTILFPSRDWFSICDEKDIMDIDIKFARNVLYQIQQIIDDTDIKLCYLAVERLHDTSSGRHSAKSIIKRDTMNLTLWNGYAQIERSSNRISEARKVYLGALGRYRSFPEHFRNNAPLLHLSFAEMELEQGRHKTAINILVNLSEEQGSIDSISETDVPVTKLLRARKYYAQQIARITFSSTSKDDSSNFLHYCVCYALLECLSQNLQQASKVFEEILQDLDIRIGNMNMIYRHSSLPYFRESGDDSGELLQDVLNRALKLFPNNTVFLSLYFHEEVCGKIPLGFQAFLKGALHKDPSHILWTVAIYDELHRQQPYNIERVRSLFNKALECSG
ncbi:14668_t:CDS:2, partial [Acaulospora morrowiae]